MKNPYLESDLVLRLRKLEKSQARYRAAFLISAAVAVALCTTGARRQTETAIQAKSFEVVNDDSKVLASFSSNSGKGEIHTFRADGNPLVKMTSSADDSGRIEVYNGDGKTIFVLATNSSGCGSLAVNSNSGDPAIVVSTTTDKNGGLWIYNADGKRIAVISTAAGSSNGMAETYDAAGTRTGHLP